MQPPPLPNIKDMKNPKLLYFICIYLYYVCAGGQKTHLPSCGRRLLRLLDPSLNQVLLLILLILLQLLLILLQLLLLLLFFFLVSLEVSSLSI